MSSSKSCQCCKSKNTFRYYDKCFCHTCVKIYCEEWGSLAKKILNDNTKDMGQNLDLNLNSVVVLLKRYIIGLRCKFGESIFNIANSSVNCSSKGQKCRKCRFKYVLEEVAVLPKIKCVSKISKKLDQIFKEHNDNIVKKLLFELEMEKTNTQSNSALNSNGTEKSIGAFSAPQGSKSVDEINVTHTISFSNSLLEQEDNEPEVDIDILSKCAKTSEKSSNNKSKLGKANLPHSYSMKMQAIQNSGMTDFLPQMVPINNFFREENITINHEINLKSRNPQGFSSSDDFQSLQMQKNLNQNNFDFDPLQPETLSVLGSELGSDAVSSINVTSTIYNPNLNVLPRSLTQTELTCEDHFFLYGLTNFESPTILPGPCSDKTYDHNTGLDIEPMCLNKNYPENFNAQSFKLLDTPPDFSVTHFDEPLSYEKNFNNGFDNNLQPAALNFNLETPLQYHEICEELPDLSNDSVCENNMQEPTANSEFASLNLLSTHRSSVYGYFDSFSYQSFENRANRSTSTTEGMPNRSPGLDNSLTIPRKKPKIREYKSSKIDTTSNYYAKKYQNLYTFQSLLDSLIPGTNSIDYLSHNKLNLQKVHIHHLRILNDSILMMINHELEKLWYRVLSHHKVGQFILCLKNLSCASNPHCKSDHSRDIEILCKNSLQTKVI